MRKESEDIQKIKMKIKGALTINDLIKAQKQYEAYVLKHPIRDDVMDEIKRMAKERRRDIQNMSASSSFGLLVKTYRTGKYTTKKLSEITGVADYIITKIEREKEGYMPRWNTIAAIIEALEIPKEEVIESIKGNKEWYCFFYDKLYEGEDCVSVRELIRYLREKKGVSLTELSMRTGIHQPNLSVFEQGKRVYTYETLKKTLKAIHITEDEFFRQLEVENQKRKEFAKNYK